MNKHLFIMVVFVTFFMISPTYGQINVFVPESAELQAEAGGHVAVPIHVSEISRADSVIAFQMIVLYDPTIIILTEEDSVELGLAAGLSPNINPSPGRLIVNAFDTAPIMGSGHFLTMNFTGVANGVSELNFETFYFNEGTPEALYETPLATVTIGSGIERNIDLVAGWNWFSLNVEGDDMSLNTVLSSIGDSGLYIKSQTQFAQYFGGSWLGNLTSIDPSSMYMIQMESAATLTFEGNPADVTTPVDLVTGWNWIGYLPQDDLPINDALDSIGDNGLYIKNQTRFAQYFNGSWLGNLTTMAVGDGYKIQMANDATLVYPE